MLTKETISQMWDGGSLSCQACFDHSEDPCWARDAHLVHFARLIEAGALENAAKHVLRMNPSDGFYSDMLRKRVKECRKQL